MRMEHTFDAKCPIEGGHCQATPHHDCAKSACGPEGHNVDPEGLWQEGYAQAIEDAVKVCEELAMLLPDKVPAKLQALHCASSIKSLLSRGSR